MNPLKHGLLPVLIGIFSLLAIPGFSAGAVNKKIPAKGLPGVETKIKQVPPQNGEKTPLWKVHWEKAREEVLQKKYPEAIQDFRRALSLKPNLDEARQELAQVFVVLERWGEAIAELEILADHQPLNQKIQKDLADLFSQKKEYRRAIEIYQRLLQKDPDNLAVRLALASNYIQINEGEKALIEWRQVHIRDSQNIEARIHLAEVLGGTRRQDEAILLLEGLVKQFPKQTSYKKKLVQILVASQRHKEALPYLLEINRHDPSDLDTHLSLAQAFSAAKNYSQSLKYLDLYLKKKPDHPIALLEKARVLANNGNFPEALGVYEKLQKIEPENRDLRREIGEAYFSSGKMPEALAEFEYLVKFFPDEPSLYGKIGEINFQNKNYSRAIPAFQKILSVDPENVYAQLHLGRAYNFSGDKEKALPYYRAVLAKQSNQNLQVELADLLFEVHQYTEAFHIYQDLLTKNPDYWEVRLKLATGLNRQKEFYQAAQQLEILIRQQPNQTAIWTLAGYNALERGDYTRAQKAFLKVLTLGDDRSTILTRLGGLWRLLGRPWKGISYLDWALTIKPGDQEIILEKAMALIDGGGLAQARTILEPLVQHKPQDFNIQRTWIRLLAALDRNEEAEIGWEQLGRQFPLEEEKLFQDQEEFYARKGKGDLALKALRKVQIKNPKNLDIQKKIGRSLIRLGRWKEAETYYQDSEKEPFLTVEVRLGRAYLMIQQGQVSSAKENLWQALRDAPDSVRIRFWLGRIYEGDKTVTEEVKRIKKTLTEVARNQEGGLLELADCFREVKEFKKAQDIYRELMEKGDDDDVLLAANRMAELLQYEKKTAQLQETLENVQKRFPRNQRISRQLVECYSQQKEYALAVKTIDGLLKAEDPRDPVLIVKKARLLERWYKHWDSQEIFQKILDPSVDQLFRKKVSEFVSLQDPLVAPLFKRPIEPRGVGSINPLLERAEERLKSHPLTSILNEKFNAVIQGLKAEALIQKKVFLEKEGKDYLWRGRGEQARIFLEELKRIDSDHEEVHQDLGKSYRLPN